MDRQKVEVEGPEDDTVMGKRRDREEEGPSVKQPEPPSCSGQSNDGQRSGQTSIVRAFSPETVTTVEGERRWKPWCVRPGLQCLPWVGSVKDGAKPLENCILARSLEVLGRRKRRIWCEGVSWTYTTTTVTTGEPLPW